MDDQPADCGQFVFSETVHQFENYAKNELGKFTDSIMAEAVKAHPHFGKGAPIIFFKLKYLEIFRFTFTFDGNVLKWLPNWNFDL